MYFFGVVCGVSTYCADLYVLRKVVIFTGHLTWLKKINN